jgi:hypothetical protein
VLTHSYSEATGHFTQLVWKNTTSMGCARKECNKDDAPGWYVACEYWPRGNVVGQFKDNVQAEEKESAAAVVSASWWGLQVTVTMGLLAVL